ncbi:MAG: DNA-processing protein DprA [Bdellovibrionota bacterium]
MNPELLSILSLLDRTIAIEDFNHPEFSLSVRTSATIEFARETLARSLDLGAEIIYPGHPDYPSSFFELEKPPLCLSVIGARPWKTHPCLSVVGSREPRRESLDWMDLHLSSLLERMPNLVLVSGGARGIDRKVHQISVRAGMPTVVFLPSGIGSPYPSDICEFFDPVISAGGAIISPFLPFQEVRRAFFEARNRLIASMGSTLFVVEARRRSGSIMTSRLAIEQGRPVGALPGFPGDIQRAGTIDLIADGAVLIRDEMDLVAMVSMVSGGDLSPSAAN